MNMTLRHQFSILLSLFLLLLLLGNLALTLMSSRDHYQEQLNARAYDAATALALALSQTQQEQQAKQERLIDVLFDRGFFAEIQFTRADGSLIHRRVKKTELDNQVPHWFKKILPIHTLPAETDVTQGWVRIGHLRLTSHSDVAYRGMWRMAFDELLLFGGMLMVSLLGLFVVLRWLFHPLKEIEQQALRISQTHFHIQQDIPKTRELKRVVLAMNKMAKRLGNIFQEQTQLAETLRNESFQDALTQLLNRTGFDHRLEHTLHSEEAFSGVLMLLQVSHYSEFNAQFGRQRGDEILAKMGAQLIEWQNQEVGSYVGRRSGVDIAIYSPASSRENAQEKMAHLLARLNTNLFSQEALLSAHIGGCFVHGHKAEAAQVLSQADVALRQAQGGAASAVVLYQQDESASQEWTSGEWQEILADVLNASELTLSYAPVLDQQNRLLHYEVFSSIIWQEKPLSAARCWPMIERHNMTAAFDYALVSQVLSELKAVQLEANQIEANQIDRASKRFCLNLSPASVADATFRSRLQSLCALNKEIASSLSFEVSEYSLANIETAFAELITTLQPYGVHFGVDKVGTGTQTFSYLQRLAVNYLRLDGNLNRGVHQALDKQFFIRSMTQIAHGLDLTLYAEGVETQADIDTLRKLNLDGASGYYFVKPISGMKEALEWN